MGMHCAGCVGRVEQALRGVPGVREVSVQLMTESAAVTAESASDLRPELLKAVRAAGYDAEVTSRADPFAALGADESAHREQLRRGRQALIQAIGLVLPILAVDHFRHDLWGHDPASQVSALLLELILLVMLALSPAGAPILVSGLRAIVFRTANMDLLITMGFTVALASSIYGTFIARDDSFVHIHAAAMILGLVCVGRYLETGARGRASAAMSALARRAPKTALVRRDGQAVSIPVARLQPGDVVVVPPHSGIPADGEIVDGSAAIDESLMTGEPMPVTRSVGDRVLGGTLVVEGRIDIRVTATGAQAALGRIAQLVAKAQSGKTAMQRLADRVAAVFTPIVIIAAALTFAAWLAAYGRGALSDAARAAIAVLVVACPCALGLATPVVVMVASGAAALRGILVRDAAMLEAMSRVDTVVWDKTGTITAGTPSVQRVVTFGTLTETDVLQLAASAQLLSPHPLAKAIVAHARRMGLSPAAPAHFESVPGAGVVAGFSRSEGGAPADILVGSEKLLVSRGVTVPESGEPVAQTHAWVAANGAVVARIELTDTIRPSARDAVRRLSALGMRSEMLTGDHAAAAHGIAEAAGIDTLHAGMDPAGKVARIERLKRGGCFVAMVGDGVNDAAALAAADVGIAFATGADVAGEAAGINLIGSTPHLVADAAELAQRSVRIIRQNLFWAFIYNVLMIPLAAVGRLPPAVAAGAMMISSLTVVLNALRLKGSGRSSNTEK